MNYYRPEYDKRPFIPGIYKSPSTICASTCCKWHNRSVKRGFKISDVITQIVPWNAAINAFDSPTAGNILKATLYTGMVFVKVNPLVAAGLAISDISGFTNVVFNGVDNIIY